MHLTKLDEGLALPYILKDKNNGVYIFVLSGQCTINQQHNISPRDGLGMWNVETLDIKANQTDTEILIIEVPMQF
jgi:quercetin 2,3-dioxygenase